MYRSMHWAGGVCIPACTGQGGCIPACTGQGGVSQHALDRGVCLGCVCPGGCLPGDICLGGVSSRGCLPGGMSALEGCLPEGCLPRGPTRGVSAQGGVCPSGVCLAYTPHAWGCLPRGVSAAVHAGIHPPPVNRITDASSENITLPELRSMSGRTVNISLCFS